MESVIWYFPIAFTGLRRVQLSHTTMHMIGHIVMPPSIAQAIKEEGFLS